ncbi:MAG: iron-containing alcohol dehydrogenase, partial [Muribaculaceae bacterium]|nr:iron-containing alcohol dehydrogenase [Muribaculaceae bacterium]
AGSLAHNGLTGCGYTEDWATHYLEHELSGLFDVAHGAGLAAVWGAWARYTVEENAARFARFGVNVLGVKPDFHDIEETALDAIAVMEDYLASIGMPTSIPQLLGRKATDEEIATMSLKASRGGNGTIGSLKVLNRNDMEAIYRMANVE